MFLFFFRIFLLFRRRITVTKIDTDKFFNGDNVRDEILIMDLGTFLNIVYLIDL